MGSVQPNLLISRWLGMNLVLSLVLVLTTLVVCQGGDGRTRKADPFPSSTDPGSSSCDPDLLPCTDGDYDTCDCPSEESSRGRKKRSTSGDFQDVLDGINKLRKMHLEGGMMMLKSDAALEVHARKRAQYLTRSGALICEHFREGTLSGKRAENLAVAHGEAMTGAAAVDMWWNSPEHEHRLNMMNDQYSRIGVWIMNGCRSEGFDAWIAVALFA